jgi:adenylosuccinate synthase
MPLTVVVGGQYGSEGKGKLVSHLAGEVDGNVAVVRCGGPNAGHTAEGEEGRALLRQLPSGAVVPGCQLFMAAGMQIDLDLLLAEIESCRVENWRLRVDQNATLLRPVDVETEETGGLYDRIASTLTGTGAAIARKVLREDEIELAKDAPSLTAYIASTARELNELADSGAAIIVEGTQGFGLSLHHGEFPYVTGRDTTAAGFLSEAGLSPRLVTDVVLVLRTYPIRVGGNSGPLKEIQWSDVAQRAKYPVALAEYTTVTGRLRRIGEFDWDLAREAVRVNRPTALAIHGVDYLDHDDLGARDWLELGPISRRFLNELESRLGVMARYIFTGPDGADLIDRGPADKAASVAEAVSPDTSMSKR